MNRRNPAIAAFFNVSTLRLLSCLIFFTTPSISTADPVPGDVLTADEIMEASYKVYRGEDAFARLVFTFHNEPGKSNRIVMLMAWKNYHNQNGVDSKIIMFNEFPPDSKDVGFLAWLYDPQSGKQDDMWLYLPELRTVRKLGYVDDPLKQPDSDQDFSRSQLNRHEMMPRYPQLDHHAITGFETIEDEECFMIESRPRHASTSPYPKRIQWIAKNSYLPLRIDYFDKDNHLLKQQTIRWQNIGNVWTWHTVSAVNVKNGQRTELEQTDMQINIGLTDDIFTKRTLKLGSKTLSTRIGMLVKPKSP